MMAEQWSNWSGSLRFAPAYRAVPADEDELAALIQRTAGRGEPLRVVGSGHSSSPLVKTRGTIVSLEKFTGLHAHDRRTGLATLGAGTTLKEANRALLEVGLAFPNLGDVDYQTVAGIVGTGTHGTGAQLKVISDSLQGVRLLNGQGEMLEVSSAQDAEFLRGARVSLGALGIFTALTFKLPEAVRLRRREWCTHVEDCLQHLQELVVGHRHFDFYWYPRSDLVKLRTVDDAERPPTAIPYARLVEEQIGFIGEILPQERTIRFDEMEYWLPAAAGPPCFLEVRRLTREKHRHMVGWRTLYRTAAGDDALLSGSGGEAAVTISLHQNNVLPFDDYFQAIEPVFRAYGGRPHWGKKSYLPARRIGLLYPQRQRFEALRRRIDPGGTFLNPYLTELLDAPRAKEGS
jgi:FAD/FMN-containing dehydrogenase